MEDERIKFYFNVVLLELKDYVVGFNVDVRSDGEKIGTKKVIIKVAVKQGIRDKLGFYPIGCRIPLKDYFFRHSIVLFNEFEPEPGKEIETCSENERGTKMCKIKACEIIAKNIESYFM